jgi:hypothetical protein
MAKTKKTETTQEENVKTENIKPKIKKPTKTFPCFSVIKDMEKQLFHIVRVDMEIDNEQKLNIVSSTIIDSQADRVSANESFKINVAKSSILG